jgi:hypothetical protein
MERYPSKAPSDYYALSGHAAELFDFAIAWAAERLPDEKPNQGTGLTLRG